MFSKPDNFAAGCINAVLLMMYMTLAGLAFAILVWSMTH